MTFWASPSICRPNEFLQVNAIQLEWMEYNLIYLTILSLKVFLDSI